MRFETITVQGGNAATLLVADGETATIVNNDPANFITLGDTDNIQTGDTYTTPFAAGQVAVFSHRTYAVAQPGVTVQILKYPGVAFLGGISAQSPSQAPPYITAASIGDGNTIDLIGGSGFPVPSGYQVQLVSGNINSGAVAAPTPSASFLVEDTLVDNKGNEYLSCEIGMSATAGQAFNSAPIQFNNCFIAHGVKLQLVNGDAGGATGVLRRCSATVVFYLVNLS